MVKGNKKAAESFTAYMQRTIVMLEEEERFGTARVYFYALRSFTEFVGGGEIFFGALNRRSLKRFENHLLVSLCSWNTVSTYARALRAIYNRAVDDELIEGDYRLFSNVFTGVKSERKRALHAEQVHRLLKTDDQECEIRKFTEKHTGTNKAFARFTYLDVIASGYTFYGPDASAERRLQKRQRRELLTELPTSEDRYGTKCNSPSGSIDAYQTIQK